MAKDLNGKLTSWVNRSDGITFESSRLDSFDKFPRPNILKSLICFILVFSFVLSYGSFVSENGKPSERPYSAPVAYSENFMADALDSFWTFHEQDEHLPVMTELLSDMVATVSIAAGGLGMNSDDFDNWQEQNMNTFYQWKFAKGFTFSQLIDGDFEFDVLGYSKQGIYYLCRPFIYTWYRVTTIIDFVAIGDFFDGLYKLLNL